VPIATKFTKYVEAAKAVRNRLNLARAFVALYLLVFVPLVLVVAFSLNSFTQQNAMHRDMAGVSRELTQRAGELQSLMYTLSVMHQVNRASASELLASFSAQLRSNNPLISAIGYYQSLTLDDRDEFEATISERVQFDYRLHDFIQDGERVVSPRRNFSLPISSIDPMSPELFGLLGTDLGASPELRGVLQDASRLNRSAMIKVPSHWPAAGQLMAFQPVYHGLETPDFKNDQVIQDQGKQDNGGYFVILDPEIFSGLNIEELASYSITLDLNNKLGSSRIVERVVNAENRILSGSWFSSLTKQQKFVIGTDYVTLTLTSNQGIVPALFLATLIFLTLTSICVGLLIVHVRQKQSAYLAREADQNVLLAERMRASTTLDTISDAVVSIDANAKILHVNPAAIQLLATPAKDLIGKSLNEYLGLHARNDPSQKFDAAESFAQLSKNARLDIDLTPNNADNSDQVLRTTLSRGVDETTGILVFRDTSTEAQLHKALEHQANHDALTGCCNRFFFEKRLEALVNSKRHNDQKHALLYMDLDQFKIINDTAGHSAGDKLLVELSNNLMRNIRDQDTLSRIGGDEFALLINDVDGEQARKVADEIYNVFQNMVFTDADKVFQVRASLGLVHFDEAGNSPSELLAAADLACYAAKDMGRNKLFVYHADDETIANTSSALNWAQKLKVALTENLFVLRMQPLLSVDSNQIHHFEFLLRLIEEDGKETSPLRIIDAAERYGLMVDVDRWVIRHAFKTIAELNGVQYADTIFGINLSGQSAADPTLIDYIKEQFKEFPVKPGQICFEVTETAAIANFSTAVDLANDVRRLGCLIALDDFGSGLSSFGYLKNLPADILKIDGQFIVDIANNPVDRAMVKSIVDVAKSMNLRTVAEFVEDKHALAVLTEIGIDLAQGFHIGKPLSLEESIEYAEQFNALTAQPAMKKVS